MIRSVLTLLIVAALAAPSLADENGKPGKKGDKGKGQGPDWDALVKRLDKDGDAQLSKDEIAAGKAEHEKGQKGPKGKGGEGKGGKQHAPGPLVKHFDEIDTNKDGKISKDEFKAFTDAMKEKAKDKKKAGGEEPKKPAEEPKKPEEPKKEELPVK